MTIQVIDIYYPNVFRRYGAKYNIFRELHETDLLALEIRGMDYKLAQKIKRIILSNKEICYTTGKKGDHFADLLSLGSFFIFKEFAKEIIAIGDEDCGQKVAHTIQNMNEYNNRSININGISYHLDSAHLVGIVNVTPDSFSDGGKYLKPEDAIQHGLELIESGAEILDIGGESSRPGSDPVPDDEEINRVIPVIEGLLRLKKEITISIDTTSARVAAEALKLGAKMVNDISSFSNDGEMLKTVKQFDAAMVLMHMKGTPKSMQTAPSYAGDVVAEVYDYLLHKTETARKAGIKEIMIDPGIGFGKSVMDNYELLKRLNEFRGIGFPIFVGLSQKSFIGKALKLNLGQRDNPTLVAETLAIRNGARFVRTHNVKQAVFASKINTFFDNPELLQYV